MVWVYDSTESLSVAMLIHASLTASLLTLNPLGILGAHLVVYSFALAAVLCLAAVVFANRKKIARRPPRTRAA